MEFKTRKRKLDDGDIEWSRTTDESDRRVADGDPPTRILVTTAPGDLVVLEECEMTSSSDTAERLQVRRAHFKIVMTTDEFAWLLKVGPEVLELARTEPEAEEEVPASERITREVPTDGD